MAKKCNETKTCVFGNGEYCGYNEYMTDSAVCPRLLDKYVTVTTITMEQIMRSKETEARND